ncbi:MAG: ABC transporter ATP-binding protein [Chloroflexia bacterium]|nr:ABC transporter ATP-binding protein [Chloroflexia bacterium]
MLSTPPPLLAASGVVKRFGAVVANDRIDLEIQSGEIVAILGENGAGKTTLLNIFAGVLQPDAGSITVRGRKVTLASPRDALALGIGTVYQHFSLVPTLSAIENILLGAGGGPLLNHSKVERRLGELGEGFAGLTQSMRMPVGRLSFGERQRVEIAKVLSRGTDILLLDEPTSILTPPEVATLWSLLRDLRARGVGVALITHKLEEALAVSDRVVVIRAGKMVGELATPATPAAMETARDQIIDWMFGAATAASPLDQDGGHYQADIDEAPALVAKDLRVLTSSGAIGIHDMNLTLPPGEIFGVAGVDGNGQKELSEALVGQRALAAGSIRANGRDLTRSGFAGFVAAGIGYVTDDRLGEGSLANGTIAENLVMKRIGDAPFARGIFVDRKAMDAHALKLMARFDIRAPGPRTAMGTLSGGTIQKVILARELAAAPRLLICNKPTSGLDARTARFILAELRAHANAGNGVILISNELDELRAVADRIGVLYQGRMVGTFAASEAVAERIGRLMLGSEARV